MKHNLSGEDLSQSENGEGSRADIAEKGESHVYVGRDPEDVLTISSLFRAVWVLLLILSLSVGTNILVPDRGAACEIVRGSGVGYIFTPGDGRSLVGPLRQIAAAHGDASLNRFDVSEFLERRSESAYLLALLGVYGGMAAA